MIYFAQLPNGAIKIGKADDVKTRLDQLRAHYGADLAVLCIMDGGREVERELHERFRHLRFGRTEQFRPTAGLLSFIGRPLLIHANPESVEEATHHLTQHGVRMTREYQEWLSRLASHDRCTMAGLIDRAVTSYAKQIEFNGQPPERVP